MILQAVAGAALGRAGAAIGAAVAAIAAAFGIGKIGKAALEAGADIINDVSIFIFDYDRRNFLSFNRSDCSC